jgi:hypothetical protein
MSSPPGRIAQTGCQTNDLCNVCRVAIDWSKSCERDYQDHLNLELQPSFTALQESALKCLLCSFIFHHIFKGEPYFRWSRDDKMMQRRRYRLYLQQEKGLSMFWCKENFPDLPYQLPTIEPPNFCLVNFPSGEIHQTCIF